MNRGAQALRRKFQAPFTRRQIAEACGVHPAAVTNWLRGGLIPKLEHRITIEQITGLPRDLWTLLPANLTSVPTAKGTNDTSAQRAVGEEDAPTPERRDEGGPTAPRQCVGETGKPRRRASGKQRAANGAGSLPPGAG